MARSTFDAEYWHYLESGGVSLSEEIKIALAQRLADTDWNTPNSDADRNAIAVMSLIEAERSDPEMRGIYLETAIEVLTGSSHPLCIAHLAVIQALLGNTNQALSLAFPAFVQTLQAIETDYSTVELVYLPNGEGLQPILAAKTGAWQAVLMLAEVMQRSQTIFYNTTGVRFLTLAIQVLPQSSLLFLKLGIAQLLGAQWEGLFALHKAHQLKQNDPKILQALFVAYRDLGQLETANFWLETARKVDSPDTLQSDFKWTTLSSEPFTYVWFEKTILAVEASFRSIVTSVLIAQGDWFEREMEFWRTQIRLGMTVLDVGANVGVYTFSAAQQVGIDGCVIAIEPFSGCVRCLQETIRINAVPQVRIRRGAASDRIGSARLALQGANELNEVISDEVEASNVEKIECFTLDSLIDTEQLDRVDFLKIDAEGHEMQVLIGSDRILAEFKPVILYENVAGTKGSNLPVAEYLIAKGYRLFRYQPYLQDLVEISSVEALDGNLNVIALPAT